MKRIKQRQAQGLLPADVQDESVLIQLNAELNKEHRTAAMSRARQARVAKRQQIKEMASTLADLAKDTAHDVPQTATSQL